MLYLKLIYNIHKSIEDFEHSLYMINLKYVVQNLWIHLKHRFCIALQLHSMMLLLDK